jgi:ParE-like toxin of type II ParDE toxin-antitoxin system
MFSIRMRSPTSPKFGNTSLPINPSAADRVLDEIEEAIRALVPFPQIGHIRPDLTSRPLRFQLVQDFLIAYAPDVSVDPGREKILDTVYLLLIYQWWTYSCLLPIAFRMICSACSP